MKTPDFWYTPSIAIPFWARALSRLYGCARALHVACTHPKDSPVPTICVGNMTAGGAGKTPVVRALRTLLNDHHPAVLMRGYGGRVTTPTWATPAHTAYDIGDEAQLHAQDGPVIVAKNRYDGARAALQNYTKLLILDDGLQNRSLRAHLNLLVIDGDVGFGNGQLLPAGPLREMLSSLLPRIDAAILINQDLSNAGAALPPDLPIFTAHTAYDPLPLGTPYIAFTGLARPQKFYTALTQTGAQIIATHDFPDHHAYTNADIADLLTQARAKGARLVTTEKDIVKIPASFHADIDTFKMCLVFDTPDALKTFIEQHLDKHVPQTPH